MYPYKPILYSKHQTCLYFLPNFGEFKATSDQAAKDAIVARQMDEVPWGTDNTWVFP